MTNGHFLPTALRDVLISITVLALGFIGAHVIETSRAIDRLDERTRALNASVVRLQNQGEVFARECRSNTRL